MSSKQVFLLARKHSADRISYAGVHKALSQLAGEGIVVKRRMTYSLSGEWVSSVREWLGRFDESVSSSLRAGTGSSVDGDGFSAGREAALKALSQAGSATPVLALAFASSAYSGGYGRVLEGIKSVVGDAPIAGCSSMGEISNRRLSGSVCVTVICAEEKLFSASVVSVPSAFRRSTSQIAGEIASKAGDFDFGLVFFPGYSRKHGFRSIAPPILEKLRSLLHGRQIIGCLAGDDWKFESTSQFAGTKALEDAVVFVAVRTEFAFATGFEHVYSPASPPFSLRQEKGVVSGIAAGSSRRFKPSVSEYCKLAGLSVDYLRDSLDSLSLKEIVSRGRLQPVMQEGAFLLAYPLALKAGGLVFNNELATGRGRLMKSSVTQAASRVKAVVRRVAGRVDSPALVLCFSCASIEALSSKSAVTDVSALRSLPSLEGAAVAGLYCGAEVGGYRGGPGQCNGSFSFLVLSGRPLRGS